MNIFSLEFDLKRNLSIKKAINKTIQKESRVYKYKFPAMTATTAPPTVKNQNKVQFGLVESASVNSITDFTSSISKANDPSTEKEKEDFVNTFICHLIFYVVFCISIVLHILIDLGLGAFLKNNLTQLIGLRMKTFTEKTPFYAL